MVQAETTKLERLDAYAKHTSENGAISVYESCDLFWLAVTEGGERRTLMAVGGTIHPVNWIKENIYNYFAER